MAKQLPKRDLENVGLGVTGACVALVTLVVAALIFMVAQKGLSAFVKDGVSVVEFFTGTKWDLANTAENGLPYTGALPLIVTSFAVMVLSTLIALPIAIGSAIFAVEIQPKFGSKIFQPLIELLTGIPSVVFGLIGFHVVVGLMKSVFHVSTGLGILPGAIVLAVMILPTMTTLSVDGLRAVSDSYRQGSLALGYTRWQTIWHVVLKSAMPSLMTAVILGMTRAFGETLAVRMGHRRYRGHADVAAIAGVHHHHHAHHVHGGLCRGFGPGRRSVGARSAADGHEPHLHPDHPPYRPQGGEGSWLARVSTSTRRGSGVSKSRTASPRAC